jgi:hypothetical protein
MTSIDRLTTSPYLNRSKGSDRRQVQTRPYRHICATRRALPDGRRRQKFWLQVATNPALVLLILCAEGFDKSAFLPAGLPVNPHRQNRDE